MKKQDIVEDIIKLAMLDKDVAEQVAISFMGFNPYRQKGALTSLEKFYRDECNNGRDSYSFKNQIASHFGVGEKQSAIISLSFRGKASTERAKNVAISQGIKNGKWKFRAGSCKATNQKIHESLNDVTFVIKNGCQTPYGQSFPGIEFGCGCELHISLENEKEEPNKKSTFSSFIRSMLGMSK